jgi:phosphopantothenoylcysteine decarboxylase / phosphopantothenate---cysteine ligase
MMTGLQQRLDGKVILLVIGGGIAAYKTLELIRLVSKAGGRTRCILTRAGAEFVTPLSLAALSGEKVFTDLFSLTDETEMGHIQLSRAADLLVVAPATADLMAKMAQGHANDLATTALLATDKPVLIAPAMNVRMWNHPATQRNLAMLKRDGVHVAGPNDGDMACGEFGPGRMAEPAEILDAITQALAKPLVTPPPPLPIAGPGALAGRHVLVTSGPTHEPIDPVRYIANRSSGQQGHALATAAARAGARVTLVSGPVAIADPPGVTVVHVETARQMKDAVAAALPADLAIFAAAVADWRSAQDVASKIKKGAGNVPQLHLVENPDILANVAQMKTGRPRLVVGFAAETDNIIAHAKSKLTRKGCDIIIANDVSALGNVMGSSSNSVHLVSADKVESWERMDKHAVASALIVRFAALLD